MRRLTWGMIIAVLAGCAGPVERSPAASPISPEDAHAGCIGTDLRQCMISIGSVLWFDMNVVAPTIARRNDTDVNGRTAHRMISITAAVPRHIERFEISLTLASPAPNGRVIKVDVFMPDDPRIARTEAEYDSTHFYEVMAPLIGNRCPGLDKLMLYRFFENQVKPRIKTESTVRKYGIFDRNTLSAHAEPLPFCGFSFTYRDDSSWNGPDTSPARRFKGGVLITLE